jgi:hypothetical protein
MSEEQKEIQKTTMLTLQRQASENINADNNLEALLKAQLMNLDVAKDVASEHRRL